MKFDKVDFRKTVCGFSLEAYCLICIFDGQLWLLSHARNCLISIANKNRADCSRIRGDMQKLIGGWSERLSFSSSVHILPLNCVDYWTGYILGAHLSNSSGTYVYMFLCIFISISCHIPLIYRIVLKYNVKFQTLSQILCVVWFNTN